METSEHMSSLPGDALTELLARCLALSDPESSALSCDTRAWCNVDESVYRQTVVRKLSTAATLRRVSQRWDLAVQRLQIWVQLRYVGQVTGLRYDLAWYPELYKASPAWCYVNHLQYYGRARLEEVRPYNKNICTLTTQVRDLAWILCEDGTDYPLDIRACVEAYVASSGVAPFEKPEAVAGAQWKIHKLHRRATLPAVNKLTVAELHQMHVQWLLNHRVALCLEAEWVAQITQRINWIQSKLVPPQRPPSIRRSDAHPKLARSVNRHGISKKRHVPRRRRAIQQAGSHPFGWW
jgi:hypothetical protein